MCGIVGYVNWGDIDTLDRMTGMLAHRGPDDSGLWQNQAGSRDRVGLGARRLSILDLSSAGHQPMSSADGSLTIVYNGEIYNHVQLRERLVSKGYEFHSHSDTETLLNLYHDLGPDCVRHLNGIFGFAIWDERHRRLFLARDHFGVKPLYYAHHGDRFAFASEAKALPELPGFQRRINHKALDEYLTFLWVPEPRTMFDGIDKIPAGHYAILQDGGLEISQYWNWNFHAADHRYPRGERELVEELRERLLATVQAQMQSDVPVGAFLSAGVDSSCIVAAMRQATDAPIHTYTIAFQERDRHGEVAVDDVGVARRTAARFGCDHTEIIFEPESVDLLPHLVWHMDEPVGDPAIIAAYLVCREARKDVKVLLSGVGGDELFAGYLKHAAHKFAQIYQRFPALLRRQLVEPMVEALPAMKGTPLKSYVRLMKKMARSGSLAPAERFLTDSTYISEDLKSHLYTESAKSAVNDVHQWATHLEHLQKVKEADWINQMLYLDAKAFMVSLNLNYTDKMSMASSVEVRVPFLDHELAEWVAANVPPGLKVFGRTTKHILREAARPLLNAEVLRQRKAGFGAPISRWLRTELREMASDLLGEASVRGRGLFRPAEVNRLVREHHLGRQDHSLQIWQLLTLELWMRTFIDEPRAQGHKESSIKVAAS